RLDAGWARAERMAVLNRSVPEVAAPAPRRFPRVFGRALAGVLAVGILAFGAFAYLSRSHEDTYATSLGQHRTVALADGSKIELNTNSVLSVTTDGGQRLASLESGEAFFQIRHDASHPFIVMAAGHRVTDLGTKFLLRLDNDHLTMMLTEGRARLEAKNSQSLLLKPGDMAVATNSSLTLHKQPAQAVAEILGWRRGLLLFDHVTIAQAATEFNRYNNRKLVVADSVAARRSVTGTFQTTNIDDFTSLARDVLGLHIQHMGQEIVISR
ncbi:MAG TPA: FecR domain-containing protein, partial [Rhizomicrobium sp.]